MYISPQEFHEGHQPGEIQCSRGNFMEEPPLLIEGSEEGPVDNLKQISVDTTRFFHKVSTTALYFTWLVNSCGR